MRTHKVEQLVIATVGFFWCFLMWFSTAAFSPSIAAAYHLNIKELGLLASSAIWMAPIGRIIAGWASDRFGAPRTFAFILAGCGLMSIASAYTTSYEILFIERVIVAIAGVSFVVGIQHVAQWFEPHEIGTAEGLYAGTGNVGAGVGALLLPRIFGTSYQGAFLWLGVIALFIAAWYLLRGQAAKTVERRDTARAGSDMRGTVFVWSRYIAIALMLAYAMSFGLEIAMNAWLPGYFARGFHNEILALGFTGVAGIQIAAGTFAAVQSFTASLFRPFAGFMSDLFQRKGWTPLPFIAKTLPYAPRLHWLGIAVILITLGMVGTDRCGPLRIAAQLRRGAGGARHLHLVRHRRHIRRCAAAVPDTSGRRGGLHRRRLDRRRHRLSADLRRSHEYPHGLSLCRALHLRALRAVLSVGGALRAPSRRPWSLRLRIGRRRSVRAL